MGVSSCSAKQPSEISRDFSSKGVKENCRMPSKNERGKDSDIPRLCFCVSLGDKGAVIAWPSMKRLKGSCLPG